MTRLQKLKATVDRKGLAVLLGFQPKSLTYILYKKNTASYSSFTIPKRSGGLRTIDAPTVDLKSLQSRLSNLLQDCISDINDGRKISGAISHGFRRKRSIITNARCHRGKRYVFNIDLTDFFGTINFGRVRGFFIKNANFALDPVVATTIAQIACYNNGLPQGSPCSPVISNLLAHPLDIWLAKLAEDCGCDYSRYADDLTFSTNKAKFPPAIAKSTKSAPHSWKPGKELQRVIKRAGFEINPAKTRMQYHESRQDVTGLVVNKKVNVPTEYNKVARAMANQLFSTGSFFTIVFEPNASGAMEEKQTVGTIPQLIGMFSFIDNVKRSNWNKDNKRPKELVGYERTYSKLLFYRWMYANERPLILLEGKTDNIYIHSALKRLGANYPALATKSGSTISINVEFMSYSATTSRMLGLFGGTGNFNRLLSEYRTRWAQYKAAHKKQPVVILLDNDDGCKTMIKSMNKNFGLSINGTEDFVHVCHNLYVVFTPLTPSGQSTTIEDFFPKSVRKQTLGGKSFNPGKPFDPGTQFGKALFAERIVRPQRDTIDFKRFRPILKRIEDAIQHYAAQP